VLPRLPLPDIDPDTESIFVEEVMVSIKPAETGAKIYFTKDGSDPTVDSEEYLEPFELSTIGVNNIKAMTQKMEWAPSRVATSKITLLERVASPSFEPYMGAFTNTVTMQLPCTTAGAIVHYTTDGTAPNAASPQYSQADGIALGLGADGNEATYVIRAVAMLPPDLGDSFVATSGEIVVQPPVAIPMIHPNPDLEGPFKDTVQSTITCETEGATIRYTVDGSIPTVRSAIYRAPVVLTKTDMVVKAKAFAAHMSPSEVAESVAFILEASDPTISPNGGIFVNTAQLTISTATPGAAIYYTLDGSTPTSISNKYTGSFAVGVTDLVVKAVALHTGLAASSVAESAAFTIQASPPQLNPSGGAFTAEALIKVTSATAGAGFRCTLDGSQPTAETPYVESPVSVTATGSLVRCVTTKSGLSVSDVTSMASPVVIKAMPPVITPDSGDFTNQAIILMSCATVGCTMHYTTDGSAPGPGSALYTKPVHVTTTATVVRAVSVAEGKSTSDELATAALSIYAAAPTFSSNGTHWLGQESANEEYFVENAFISMESNTPGGVIVYTTDGQSPTTDAGIPYTEPYEV